MSSVVELAKIKGVATLTVGDVSVADLPKGVKAMTSTVAVINKALVIYPTPIKEMGGRLDTGRSSVKRQVYPR